MRRDFFVELSRSRPTAKPRDVSSLGLTRGRAMGDQPKLAPAHPRSLGPATISKAHGDFRAGKPAAAIGGIESRRK